MNNQPGIAQQNSGPFTFQGNSVSSNVILPPPVLSVTAAQSQNIPLSFPQSNPFNFSSPQTPPQQTNAALQMPNPTPQFNFNAFQQQYQNSQQQQPNSFIPQTNAFMQQQLSNQFPPPPQSNILLQQQQPFPQQFSQQQFQPASPINSPPFYSPGNGVFFGPQATTTGLRLLQKIDPEKKVVAVIVTFSDGCTYDPLFTSVQQKSMQGTQVVVYSCSSNYIGQLFIGLTGDSHEPSVKQLVGFMNKVDPDCVVFNWECCSGYSGSEFHEGADLLFKFVKAVLNRGHMAMFSDFSLKALIGQWKQQILGPNPFFKVSETSGTFQIKFNAADLRECPSSQLQIIGQMAQGGTCNIIALGGTIVYSVNKEVGDNPHYTLQVLTVNVSHQAEPENLKCRVNQAEGVAGHVLLRFKEGGTLLTSMGHWIELMKIDTSEKKLFEVAQREYGKQYAQQMQQTYAALSPSQQPAYLASNATNFVQNQAPCSNMYRKNF